jgi:hypothetical protein
VGVAEEGRLSVAADPPLAGKTAERIRRGTAMGVCNTPIQMEWFYYLEGEKTKLNWFLLEFALAYYENIRDSETLTFYRKRYDKEQIAQFCTYYARRLKKSLLNCLRGRTKSIVFQLEYVDDFYPHHVDQMNRTLHSVAKYSYDNMLFCDNCPQQCLIDYKARSLQFEEWKE